MPLSEHDVTHIHDIMAGDGTWFSAQLLRLIAKADPSNRAILAQCYPNEVKLVRWWWDHRSDDPPPLELVDEQLVDES